MAFDLDHLQLHCSGLSLDTTRVSTNVLEVSLKLNLALVFMNLAEEHDTLIGFKGTPWHAHDSLILMVGEANYIELNECELLSALKEGDVVVVEQFYRNVLKDRWIAHKLEPFDIQYIEPDEEIRIHRLY